MSTRAGGVPLDEARADFLTHHVSIIVGSCSAQRVPSVVRAYGCRVAADRGSVTVYLSVAQSTRVLEDLRAGAGVTAVFSRPSTHETVQLKGTRAEIGPLQHGDREYMRLYGRSFSAEIAGIGFGEAFAGAIMAGVEDEAVAVTFAPEAAFEQTPGPLAGQPLVPRT